MLLEQPGVSLRQAELAAAYLAAWPDPARQDLAAEALADSVARSASGGWALALRAPTTAEPRIRPIAFVPWPAVCGRYTLTTRKSDEIQARLLETLGLEAPPPDSGFERFNIAPSQRMLGVIDDRAGRRIEELR